MRVPISRQDSSQAKRVIGLSLDAIDYYQTFLGPFPFKEFNVVEEMSWGYGQAPPVFMYITQEAFKKFLLAYQTNFRWKFGSTLHVAGLLKAMTKKDWMPYFDANYWGTGLP